MTTEELLDYLLKETEVAIRMMLRDGSTVHIFNIGTKTMPDGEQVDLCMIMVVSTRIQADELAKMFGGMVDCKPLSKPS